MTTRIEGLIQAVRDEAARATFPVDELPYRKAGISSLMPILFAGELEAPLAILGRDLGRDEVLQRQPLVGAAGQVVRKAIVQNFDGREPDPSDPRRDAALRHVLLTNTVPYKPPGNRAYSDSVKERFRPFIAQLLVDHWRGSNVITLGTEAFEWFQPYDDDGRLAEFWKRDDRFAATVSCRITGGQAGSAKSLTLLPLPHPSPLNRRWHAQFPRLLDDRLRPFVQTPRSSDNRPA